MLKIIRKKGFIKKVLWILTFVIIISFGFWGTTARVNTPNGRLDYAGKIFGKKVSFEQFEETQRHARHQALLRYGEEFFKISPFLNLEEEAWNRLILAYEAQKQRLKVTDREVVESIEGIPRRGLERAQEDDLAQPEGGHGYHSRRDRHGDHLLRVPVGDRLVPAEARRAHLPALSRP